MKACVLTATGKLDHLALTDVPKARDPGPGEVRVAIRAAALNHLDLFVAEGLVGVEYAFPKIVGADAAGVVEAIAGGTDAVGLSAKLANSIGRSNALHKTYAPVEIEAVRKADGESDRDKRSNLVRLPRLLESSPSGG